VALSALTILAGSVSAAAQDTSDGPRAVVLFITYADGRTTPQIVTEKVSRSWTPLFPRVPGWQPLPQDLPASAVNYEMRLRGGVVDVDVSVFRGESHERHDAVAKVVVGSGAPVTVGALEAFGVQPVTMSLTPLVAAAPLAIPRVINRTAGLEVADIEALQNPSPAYRITVKNLSAKPVVAFQVVTYRDDQRTLTGTKLNQDGTPVIEANGVYAFSMSPSRWSPAGVDGWSPASHEVLEITSALWEDGSVEGDVQPMAMSLTINMGRRTLLARGLAILRAVPNPERPLQAKAWLKQQLEELSIEPDAATEAAVRARLQDVPATEDPRMAAILRSAMANARRGMVDDLDAAPEQTAAFQRWLAEAIDRYEKRAARFTVR
jgi:hypothetical protein